MKFNALESCSLIRLSFTRQGLNQGSQSPWQGLIKNFNGL